MKVPIYSIDSGVPVPSADRGGMPLNRLEVGESFVFPQEKRQSVLTMTGRIKQKTGKEFTVRKIDEKVARVWRTK